MLKKIKSLVQENRALHKTNLLQLKELEWAHVYHDSIRGKEWLEKLPLNIGRWAGNYSFFYVLNRILSDFKPNSILEFGLGESSKFINAYIQNELKKTKYHIIEQDENWKNIYIDNNVISENTTIFVCPILEVEINNFKVNTYANLKQKIKYKYDLYVVDGPLGSSHYSRYDIYYLAKEFKESDQFIILLDDYNRSGEKETAANLVELFKEKNIKTYHTHYTGAKSVFVIASEKYKYVKSL